MSLKCHMTIRTRGNRCKLLPKHCHYIVKESEGPRCITNPNFSCSSKSRLVLPFLVLPFWCRLTWIVPDKIQEGRKTVVCVCVCVCVWSTELWSAFYPLTICTSIYPQVHILHAVFNRMTYCSLGNVFDSCVKS